MIDCACMQSNPVNIKLKKKKHGNKHTYLDNIKTVVRKHATGNRGRGYYRLMDHCGKQHWWRVIDIRAEVPKYINHIL